MKKIINWGVIGSGGIARRRTIPEGIMKAQHARLISVYDINSVVNAEVARDFDVIAAQGIGELLEANIDAVYVASPVDKHFEHVVDCARRKKHVLCEKPLSLSVSEVEKMIFICRKEGIQLGTGLLMRFHSQHQTALKMIQEAKLGKLVYGRAQLSCWYPPIEGAWRQNPETGGGGSLMDMGSHCIDLLEMFLGKVKSVSCFINNRVHDYPSEDSALVSMIFENGALGTVDTFFCIPDDSSKNILELYGSKGSIIAKGTIGQGDSGEMIAFLDNDDPEYNAGQERKTSEGMLIAPKPLNTYMAEIEDFSQSILENRSLKNNDHLGLRNQKMLAACYESARTGKVVEIH